MRKQDYLHHPKYEASKILDSNHTSYWINRRPAKATSVVVVNTSADNIVCIMPQLVFTQKECKRL